MWKTAWFCVNCHGRLSFGVKMDSHGRCPLCGYKDKHAITVVRCYERAYRWRHSGPWWRFWGGWEREWAPQIDVK